MKLDTMCEGEDIHLVLLTHKFTNKVLWLPQHYE